MGLIHAIAVLMVVLAVMGLVVDTARGLAGKKTGISVTAIGPAWVGIGCLAVTVFEVVFD